MPRRNPDGSYFPPRSRVVNAKMQQACRWDHLRATQTRAFAAQIDVQTVREAVMILIPRRTREYICGQHLAFSTWPRPLSSELGTFDFSFFCVLCGGSSRSLRLRAFFGHSSTVCAHNVGPPVADPFSSVLHKRPHSSTGCTQWRTHLYLHEIAFRVHSRSGEDVGP